jgi:hypothetical protein
MEVSVSRSGRTAGENSLVSIGNKAVESDLRIFLAWNQTLIIRSSSPYTNYYTDWANM